MDTSWTTCSAENFVGAPLRWASRSVSITARSKTACGSCISIAKRAFQEPCQRLRHRPTQCRSQPTASAISEFDFFSNASRIIFARAMMHAASVLRLQMLFNIVYIVVVKSDSSRFPGHRSSFLWTRRRKTSFKARKGIFVTTKWEVCVECELFRPGGTANTARCTSGARSASGRSNERAKPTVLVMTRTADALYGRGGTSVDGPDEREELSRSLTACLGSKSACSKCLGEVHLRRRPKN